MPLSLSLPGRVAGRLIVVVVAVLGVPIMAAAQAPATPMNRLLVMPFDNVSHEGRLYWLSEASAVLLTDDLNAMGTPAITRDQRIGAFERLHVPPVATLSHATVIKVGELVGASQVIIGELQLEGDNLVMRARAIRLDTGRLAPDIVERGPLASLFAICERVARRLAPSSTVPVEQVERVHPPLGAFESFIKGLVSETPATQLRYLDEALKAAPTLHRARLAQWAVYTEMDDHPKALQAVRGVPEGTPWTRRARFEAALSHIALGQLDDAYQTLSGLLLAAASPGILNNLGIVQLRRGNPAATGRATQYFGQALKVDPESPDLSFNMGYAAWLEKDLPNAVYWLRETVRRNPADADAHFVLGAALQASGTAAEATRERDLAGRLSSQHADKLKRPGGEVVPRGLERLSADVDVPDIPGIESLLVASGRREQREVADFHLERGRRLFQQEQDREAMLELRRVLYLQPYQAEALRLLGQIYLRGGRIQDAIDTLKVSLWSVDTAAAHAVLADALLQNRDEAAARAEAERALALDPANETAHRVIGRLPKGPGGVW